MRLQNYLQSLESLATANSVLSPSAISVERGESFKGAYVFDGMEFGESIIVITDGGEPIGFLSHQSALAKLFELMEADVDADVPIGELCEPLPTSMASLDSTFNDILRLADDLQSELILVEGNGSVLGSVCGEDMLKPPGLIFLLCLSLDLESAAVDLCSLYDCSFESLDEDRRKAAIQRYTASKQQRWGALDELRDGQPLHKSIVRREVLQCTMLCDKKTMMTRCDLGLITPKKQIERVFRFCERVRNYVAHPSASFTRSWVDAERVQKANHEPITTDGSWTLPVAIAVSEELSIGGLQSLSRSVRECRELVADVDRALNTTSLPPE